MRLVQKIDKMVVPVKDYPMLAKEELTGLKETLATEKNIRKRMQTMKYLCELGADGQVRMGTDQAFVAPVAKIFSRIVKKGQTEQERVKAMDLLNNIMFKGASDKVQIVDDAIDTMLWAMKHAPTQRERKIAAHRLRVNSLPGHLDNFFIGDTDAGDTRVRTIFYALAEHSQTAETSSERASAATYCAHIAEHNIMVRQDAAAVLQENIRYAATKKERIASMECLKGLVSEYSEHLPTNPGAYISANAVRESIDLYQTCTEDANRTQAERNVAGSIINEIMDDFTVVRCASPKFLIRSGTLAFSAEKDAITKKTARLGHWLFKQNTTPRLSKYADNCLEVATDEFKKTALAFGNNTPDVTLADVQQSCAATEYYQDMQRKLKVG